MNLLKSLALGLMLLLAIPFGGAGSAAAQMAAPNLAVSRPDAPSSSLDSNLNKSGGSLASDAEAALESLEDEGRLSTAIEIAILLTVLSLLPALLISITSFTRIVIVLSFVRRALSVNELPPNPVLIGLALFLTMFVMAPVGETLHEKAWEPYREGEVSIGQATDVAWDELSTFLIANTRESELELFADLAKVEHEMQGDGIGAEELPVTVVIPAFVLSELKTAFQMGFLLFLPFLVIDLIVSSVLLSMGMFMLPPAIISTPFKILLFVLVDGWDLVVRSIVQSFQT